MWLQDGAHPQQWHRELFVPSLHHRLPRFSSKRLKEEFVPLCRGAYPKNGVFPSGEPRTPSHSEADPAFFRSTDPDSPRSAGRCGLPACLLPPPPLAAPGARSLGESRDPLCPPPPPVGFRRSTEPSFPGGRMGKPPESPQDGAEGRLDAPRLSFASPFAPLTCGLPAAIARCCAANDRHFFKLQPSREAARLRQRPLAGSGSGKSRRAALEKRGSSSRPARRSAGSSTLRPRPEGTAGMAAGKRGAALGR